MSTAETTTAVRYRAAVERRELDADGLIADFTVMLRPLSALVPFAQAMGERAQAAGLQTTRA